MCASRRGSCCSRCKEFPGRLKAEVRQAGLRLTTHLCSCCHHPAPYIRCSFSPPASSQGALRRAACIESSTAADSVTGSRKANVFAVNPNVFAVNSSVPCVVAHHGTAQHADGLCTTCRMLSQAINKQSCTGTCSMYLRGGCDSHAPMSKGGLCSHLMYQRAISSRGSGPDAAAPKRPCMRHSAISLSSVICRQAWHRHHDMKQVLEPHSQSVLKGHPTTMLAVQRGCTISLELAVPGLLSGPEGLHWKYDMFASPHHQYFDFPKFKGCVQESCVMQSRSGRCTQCNCLKQLS